MASLASAACSGSVSPDPGASTAPSSEPGDRDLVAAARKEGSLTTIALPRGWCNYGAIIDTFKSTYGLEVAELDPNAISADQIEVLRDGDPDAGGQAPDVVDLGLTYGPQAREEGLVSPYKVAGWESIPGEARDADGHWWGGYYGVIAFEVNTQEVADVPRDWADLLRPEHKGLVSLAGDPHTSSQAVAAVYAAALANGGSLDDVGPGLDYFRRLSEAGNLAPKVGTSDTVVSGRTPIVIRWTYHGLADRARALEKKGPEIVVVVPSAGRLAVPYVQAISATAPHPSAARLWEEYLLADIGQELFLEGGCHPIRLDDMLVRGVVSRASPDGWPATEGASFPTASQLDAATTTIADGWDEIVGLTIR